MIKLVYLAKHKQAITSPAQETRVKAYVTHFPGRLHRNGSPYVYTTLAKLYNYIVLII